MDMEKLNQVKQDIFNQLEIGIQEALSQEGTAVRDSILCERRSDDDAISNLLKLLTARLVIYKIGEVNKWWLGWLFTRYGGERM